MNKNLKSNLKLTVYFVSIALLSIVSCSKDIIGFDMIYRNKININAGLNTIELHNFVISDIATDTSVFFQAANKTKDDVKTILPKLFTINETSLGVPLSFINKAEVIISTKGDPNQKPTVIFYRDDITLNNGTTLDLLPNNVDLRPFIYTGSYDLRLRLTLRSITQQSINPDVSWSFLAQIN
jgi:hypothetical protein